MFSWVCGKPTPETRICKFRLVRPLIGNTLGLTVLPLHRLEEYLSIRGAEYLASVGYPVDSASPGHQLGVTQDPTVRSEYKPGAGMAPGEVILPYSAQQQHATGRGWFGFGGGKNQAATGSGVAVPPHAQAAPSEARYGATANLAERA